MASRLALLLFCSLLAAGCGVKALPAPMDSLNPKSVVLSVQTLPQGVEVSFSAPGADRPDQVLEQVIFSYTYAPLAEDPACPGCPPVLKYSRAFNMERPQDIAESRKFVWLDSEAPSGQQAIYQAVVVDTKGRRSGPSSLARGYALALPPAPAKVRASTLEDSRLISWQASAPMEDPGFTKDRIGYIVERRGPEGIVALNQRPLFDTSLRDYTANASRTYRYRVVAARCLQEEVLVRGEPGPWVKAAPFGRTSSLLPPTDLVAVSVKDGIYLRFEPVADPDTKGYVIERRSGQGAWRAVKESQDNTYIDKDVSRGHYYQYRVMAIDEEGDMSSPSEALNILYQFEEEQ